MRERPASLNEQLEHVVEARRVALSLRDDGDQFGEVAGKMIGRHAGFADAHPCEIAAQRVDLAIVAHVAIRMREWPRWKGVRREARMDERKRGGEVGVDEIGIEMTQLRRAEHALVDECARRETGDVDGWFAVARRL